MIAILEFLFQIVNSLLGLLEALIVVSVVVSWLVTFDVINLRNQTAYNVVRVLENISRPLLAPIRRIIPPIGSLDITPMIAIIVIEAARATLLRALFGWLGGLLR